MSIFTCQIERDAAMVLSDTKGSSIDHSRTFSTSKCSVIPHIPAMVTGRGIASVIYAVVDRISNGGYQSFDQVMEHSGQIVREAYEKCFEDWAGRFGFYEKMAAHGYDLEGFSFMDLMRSLAQDQSFNVQCDVVIIGWSPEKKRMTGVVVTTYDFQETPDTLREAFNPIPMEGPEIVLFGAETPAIHKWISDHSGRVPANMNELKSVLGAQYQWIVDTAEEAGLPEHRLRDCGGDILCTTITKDKTVNQQYVGTLEQCVQLAQGNPQGNGANWHQKPGRNSPCPCGSGKKYKRCCGK